MNSFQSNTNCESVHIIYLCKKNAKLNKRNDNIFISLFAGSWPHLCGGSLELSHIYDSPQTKNPLKELSEPQPTPEYISADSGNVTAILGKTAILNCRVKGVGNKTVSWIRHKDTHLLTAGR